MGYGSGELAKCDTMDCEPAKLTLAQELQRKRDKVTKQLAEIDTTIYLFAKHPEVEQCLTQLAKCGIYR